MVLAQLRIFHGTGRLATAEDAGPVGSRRPPLIRCSATAPSDAYVAVRYRGHWFWIDDRDVLAKREFAFIMMLFTMTDRGADRTPPALTIPTQ